MVFIAGSSFRKYEQVLRIMTLSRLMSDCSQSDTSEFAAGLEKTVATLFAAQSVRPDSRQSFAINPESLVLRSDLLSNEQIPYPLRT